MEKLSYPCKIDTLPVIGAENSQIGENITKKLQLVQIWNNQESNYHYHNIIHITFCHSIENVKVYFNIPAKLDKSRIGTAGVS